MRRAALAIARDVERRAPAIATSKWWKEERHGVFLDYNQNAKDRTVASAYSVRPLPDARVSMPLRWDEVPTSRPRTSRSRPCPRIYASDGDPGAGIDDAVGSLEALLELSRRHEAEGQGDAPWPPNYAKQAGEPPRVQPSRHAAPPSEYNTPEAEAERERAPTRSGRGAGGSGRGGGPERRPPDRVGRDEARRRRAGARSTIPVIEISRAAKKDEALGGPRALEGAPSGRRPALLEPADVLVDGMRGRSTIWYRVRVNLTHVPEAERPAQEPLESDYDPWSEYEWPDRAGQLERAPRKKKPSG